MKPIYSCITLLTDFGTRDGYVAAMKGVIQSEAPGVMMVDAAHDIPPQQIFAAAWALTVYHRVYPPGTIHVVVVDPGVGTDRVPLCVEADGQVYIAPDNGVLHLALAERKTVRLRRLRPEVHRSGPVSATFHGRDVFAYAAGLLASGKATIDEITEPLDSIVQLPAASLEIGPTWVQGAIVHIDSFGNMITNIREDHLARLPAQIRVIEAGRHCRVDGLQRAYAQSKPGELLALINSSGYLELAVNGGSAVAVTRLTLGSIVRAGL